MCLTRVDLIGVWRDLNTNSFTFDCMIYLLYVDNHIELGGGAKGKTISYVSNEVFADYGLVWNLILQKGPMLSLDNQKVEMPGKCQQNHTSDQQTLTSAT